MTSIRPSGPAKPQLFAAPDDEQALLDALASVSSPRTMRRLLTDILTPAEYATLCRRWSILRQIRNGRTQRAIASDLHASLCNITRGARILRSPDSAAARILDAAGRRPAPTTQPNEP